MQETSVQVRCLEKHCKHRGPADWNTWEERHPYGDGYATECLMEPVCEKCGSVNVVEINED